MRRIQARRARSCAGKACTPATSWTGDEPGTPARWPRWPSRGTTPAGSAGRQDRSALPGEGPTGAGAGQGPLRGDSPVKTAGALGAALRERGQRPQVDTVTDDAIATLAPVLGTRAACAAVGRPPASHYRRHRSSPAPQRPAPVAPPDRAQPRALSPVECQAILDALHSDRFVD